MRGTNQVGGTHYLGKDGKPVYDLCDLAQDTGLPFHHTSCMKYIARHDKKNRLEDVRKAKSYAQSIKFFNDANYALDMKPRPIKMIEDMCRFQQLGTRKFLAVHLERYFMENTFDPFREELLSKIFWEAFEEKFEAMDSIIKDIEEIERSYTCAEKT